MIAKYIDDFIEEYGGPTTFVPAAPEVLERLRGSVPEVFFDYWETFGFSVFMDGLFQLVNPETYRVPLTEWVEGNEMENSDNYHVLLITAFGQIYTWGTKTGYAFDISLILDAVLLNKKNNAKDISNGNANIVAEDLFFKIYLEKQDVSDSIGPMFARAVEKLGPLGPDQMYGLVPAVPLGGKIALDNLQIVSAPEYMSLCASLSERPVLGFNDLVQRAFGAGAVDAANEALDGQ